MKFETRAIHDGQPPDPATGAVIVPVYQTSTYEQDAVGRHRGFEYSRTGNPTRTALETALASLEGGRHGLAYASGVAATAAVFSLLSPGDRILAGTDLYGGTYRLLEKIFRKWGIDAAYVDASDPEAVAAAADDRTRMIWIETPTNPLLQLADLKALAVIARERAITLAVDNTFATPFFQRPLEEGADIVVHSTTKYLGGHSDVVGGAVVINDDKIHSALQTYQNAAGAVPGPWDCWLVLRGIKTLAARMKVHDENARRLAGFLEKSPAVERVYYPGLAGQPGHELARRQMTGFGGMISFDLKGGFAAVERFLEALKLFILAESLGGVESLVCYPPRMTHGAIPSEERRKRGIGDGLIRLSVGIEHPDDLEEDLRQALEKIEKR